MAFRILYKGLEVFCDTPQEVDALASQRKVSPERFPRLLSEISEKPDIKGMVQSLKKNQQALLRHLVAGPQSDADLRTKMNLDGNKALAGVLSGVSKAAKRMGLEPRGIINKTASRNGTGERHYQYSLVPEAMEDVKRGLKIRD